MDFNVPILGIFSLFVAILEGFLLIRSYYASRPKNLKRERFWIDLTDIEKIFYFLIVGISLLLLFITSFIGIFPLIGSSSPQSGMIFYVDNINNLFNVFMNSNSLNTIINIIIQFAFLFIIIPTALFLLKRHAARKIYVNRTKDLLRCIFHSSILIFIGILFYLFVLIRNFLFIPSFGIQLIAQNLSFLYFLISLFTSGIIVVVYWYHNRKEISEFLKIRPNLNDIKKFFTNWGTPYWIYVILLSIALFGASITCAGRPSQVQTTSNFTSYVLEGTLKFNSTELSGPIFLFNQYNVGYGINFGIFSNTTAIPLAYSLNDSNANKGMLPYGTSINAYKGNIYADIYCSHNLANNITIDTNCPRAVSKYLVIQYSKVLNTSFGTILKNNKTILIPPQNIGYLSLYITEPTYNSNFRIPQSTEICSKNYCVMALNISSSLNRTLLMKNITIKFIPMGFDKVSVSILNGMCIKSNSTFGCITQNINNQGQFILHNSSSIYMQWTLPPNNSIYLTFNLSN